MTDDEFNRLFRDSPGPDPAAWVILALGVIVMLLIVWLWAVVPVSAAENEGCMECNVTEWQLRLNGDTIIAGMPSEEDCLDELEDLEPQTPPFSDLKCVEVLISEHDA